MAATPSVTQKPVVVDYTSIDDDGIFVSRGSNEASRWCTLSVFSSERTPMPKQYWLMKSEPNVFSIDDLKDSPDGTEHWDGVRNYKARNYIRDEMKVGDVVLFYHSNIDPSVVGTATVVKEGYPDHTAWNKREKYYDPKSPKDSPRWFMVDVKFKSKFARPLPLAELRTVTELEGMVLLKKGMRLSIQPVSPGEYKVLVALAKKKPR